MAEEAVGHAARPSVPAVYGRTRWRSASRRPCRRRRVRSCARGAPAAIDARTRQARRVAVVTGGARRLGRHLCLSLRHPAATTSW
ncbi:MAG: hypothetical protein MZW92_52870 [Comamonadaceae bacterium]|nr:hypothetical protein [Comamonadaceae bacterium]